METRKSLLAQFFLLSLSTPFGLLFLSQIKFPNRLKRELGHHFSHFFVISGRAHRDSATKFTGKTFSFALGHVRSLSMQLFSVIKKFSIFIVSENKSQRKSYEREHRAPSRNALEIPRNVCEAKKAHNKSENCKADWEEAKRTAFGRNQQLEQKDRF